MWNETMEMGQFIGMCFVISIMAAFILAIPTALIWELIDYIKEKRRKNGNA